MSQQSEPVQGNEYLPDVAFQRAPRLFPEGLARSPIKFVADSEEFAIYAPLADGASLDPLRPFLRAAEELGLSVTMGDLGMRIGGQFSPAQPRRQLVAATAQLLSDHVEALMQCVVYQPQPREAVSRGAYAPLSPPDFELSNFLSHLQSVEPGLYQALNRYGELRMEKPDMVRNGAYLSVRIALLKPLNDTERADLMALQKQVLPDLPDKVYQAPMLGEDLLPSLFPGEYVPGPFLYASIFCPAKEKYAQVERLIELLKKTATILRFSEREPASRPNS